MKKTIRVLEVFLGIDVKEKDRDEERIKRIKKEAFEAVDKSKEITVSARSTRTAERAHG